DFGRVAGCPRFDFLPGSWGFGMPSGLKRYYGQGDLHFVTFSCYQRLPLLRTKCARNVFVHELDKVRNETRFRLVGYVVMPEHVHLLMSEPLIGTPSTVLQKLKLRVSLRIRKAKGVDDAVEFQSPIEEEGIPPRRSGRQGFTILMSTQ